MITFSPNTMVDDRVKVCNNLGFTKIYEPGKYLGLPMVIGRGRVATYSFLLDRIEQKLQT